MRGVVRLISSTKDHVGEDGPGDEPELLGLLVVDRDAGEVGGQEVRGCLDPAEGAVDGCRDGPGQHGLAHPRHAVEEQVPLGEQAHHGGLDGLPAAGDDPLDVVHHAPEGGGRAGEVGLGGDHPGGPSTRHAPRLNPRLAWGCRRFLRSERITRAAFAPGAPVMPPPGWAPEPHRYSPSIPNRYRAWPRSGPPGEELVQAGLGVQRVPAREPVLALQVDRRDHLPCGDQLAQPGRVLLHGLHHEVAHALAFGFPVALAEPVRRPLHQDAHHVRALGREGRIQQGGDGGLQVRLVAHPAVLRRVERFLQVVDARAR